MLVDACHQLGLANVSTKEAVGVWVAQTRKIGFIGTTWTSHGPPYIDHYPRRIPESAMDHNAWGGLERVQ